MMLKIMMKLFSECNLCSLSVLKLVDKAGRGGNKVSKIRVQRIIDEGD
jgi:hypothetical protein